MKSKSPIIPAVLTTSPDVFGQRLTFAREQANAAHFDVTDGQFSPGEALAIELWPPIELAYSEAHLMVKKPEEYLEALAERKITRAIIHVEADYTLASLHRRAKELDILLGFAICPDTDLAKLQPVFAISNYIQVMGVHPGFSGQGMIDTTLPAIRFLRTQHQSRLIITVDGGVTLANAAQVFQAGADYVISTNAIFHGSNWVDSYQALAQTADARSKTVGK
jgi:ribulose-phosphate 3-epimerase